jgi:hypothetical protein
LIAAVVLFLPNGLYGIYRVLKASDAQERFLLARKAKIYSVCIFLIGYVILSFYVYWQGGKFLQIMDTFY